MYKAIQGQMACNYVAGYTRSLPSSIKGNPGKCQSAATSIVSSAQYNSQSTNPSGSSGGKVVHVRGYTRSDGTRVASYTRSLPTKKSKKTFAAVHPESVPIATTGGGAQIAKCTKLSWPMKMHPIHGSTCIAKPIAGVQPKRELIKKEKLAATCYPGLKKLHQQPLLDTTNTSHLPTTRVSEQQEVQSKDTFKLHSPPLKHDHCRPVQMEAQTADQGSYSSSIELKTQCSERVHVFREELMTIHKVLILHPIEDYRRSQESKAFA